MTEEQETVQDAAAAAPSQPEAENLATQLKAREAIIAGLEQSVTARDSEVTALKQAADEATKKLSHLGSTLEKAVASYKTMAIKANPAVPAELVTGNSIEEVNESVEKARAIIDRVRQSMEAEASRTRVPAGAPQRAPIDLAGLSAREKIQYAIGGKK